MFISSTHYPCKANLFFFVKNITHLSPTFFKILNILHKADINTICDTNLADFYTSADILARQNNFVRGQTSCQKCIFFRLLTQSGPILSFGHWKNSTNSLFVIFAKFESIFKPIDNVNKDTRLILKHEICSAAGILV